MSIFEFISVALSFVIGLGIARLLTSIVGLFRARSKVRLHWIPFAWAGMIFLWMIQYWWGIYELSGIIKEWTMWRFVYLLVLTLFLFASAALLLPSRPVEETTDLFEDFRENGRWALAVLVAYFIVAMPANKVLFAIPLTGPMNLLLASLALCPVIVLLTNNRRIQSIATLLNLPLSVFAFLQFSPDLY